MSRRSKEKVPAVRSDAPGSWIGERPGAAASHGPESARRPAGLSDRWTVLGVCLFLAAAIWVVFGQTLHYAFVNFDDDDYVYENPEVARGLTLQGDRLGVHPCLCRQLAPADLDFPHAGLPVLRIASRRPSSDQCPAPHGDGDPAFPGAAADDRRSCGAARLWRRCLRFIRCGWNRWRGWRNARTCSAECSSC